MDKQMELVEKLSAQIVEWEAQIARLEDQAKSAPAGAQDPHREAIAALQLKRQQAQKQLQGIGTGNTDPLGDLEKGAEGILDNVKSGLRDAVLKVK